MKKQLFLLAFAALALQGTPALADRDDDWRYWRHNEDGARWRGRGFHHGWRNGGGDGGSQPTDPAPDVVDEANEDHVGEGD